MPGRFLEKLKRLSASGERSDRASILLPFLIIAVGIAVLAGRSVLLSVQMERGASTMAAEYVHYAAEITAHRVDNAVRGELQKAIDEWQLVERRLPGPSFETLQSWINHN